VLRPPLGLELTIEVFRDLEAEYPFLRLAPPPAAGGGAVSRDFWLRFASLTQDRHDVLEAWHAAAWQQCSDLGDQVIARLQEALPQYTYAELASVTYNLASLAEHRPAQMDGLAARLDEQLSLRMEEMLAPANPGLAAVEECLRVAFVWLRGSAQLGSVRLARGSHNRALVRVLASRHLGLLPPRHLVFLLALAGIHRSYPHPEGRTSQRSTVGHPVPPALAAPLAAALPSLTHREAGVVCHALHQANLHLETQHHELRCLSCPASRQL
jgi:hypothetical protein